MLYSIKARNELPQDTKVSSSVAKFKSKRNKNLPKKYKLSDHGSKKASSSNLNAHLYERFINEGIVEIHVKILNTFFFLVQGEIMLMLYQCNFTVNTNI